MTGGLRSFSGSCDVLFRQTGKVGRVVEKQGGGFHGFLGPLAEFSAQPGEFGVDCTEPVLSGVIELDAGLAELLEVFLHKPDGLSIEAVDVDGREAFVKAAVHVYGVLVGRKPGGKFSFKRLDVIARIR
ncbi:hypothetical protein PJL18_01671 [Paenarthrobacter nicotinovorans]|nr:hypothetical protein [Paenarthrobacter nicotinovorans]